MCVFDAEIQRYHNSFHHFQTRTRRCPLSRWSRLWLSLFRRRLPVPLFGGDSILIKIVPNSVSKLTFYDNRKLNSVQVSARGMSPQRWQLAQCSTFCEGDIITSRAKIQEQFSTIENLQCLEKIQDKFSISLQDSAMCLKFCQKDPACNFYKVENKHNDVMIIGGNWISLPFKN